MRIQWTTLALQTVNFAVLVWLLQRFLYRPVLRGVDARRAEIAQRQANAEKAQAVATERLAAIESERAGIAAERAATLQAATLQAQEDATRRHAEAERDAAALLDSTRKTIEQERQHVLAEARQAAVDLAADMVRRLLAEVPLELRAQTWLERISQHLAALPESERKSLGRQLVNGTGLRVLTAGALPSDIAERWRRQIQQTMGDPVGVIFEVDPEIIAGAELHFPDAVLRFGLTSALTELRTAVASHGNAQ